MKVLKIIGIVVGVFVAAILVFAGVNHVAPLNMVSSDEYDTHSGIAIRGYDPVSYFVSNTPQIGSEDFQYEWNKAKWYFASAENKNSFVSNPEKYAPQFGGYCGFAVSTGFSASADPATFKIREGKLYLFNNQEVIAEAQKGGQEFWSTAESNWLK